MPAFLPESLARQTGGRWTGPRPGPLWGFCADTRRLQPGQAFVALQTDRRDGHDYLPQAAQAGASAALVARWAPPAELPQLVVPDPLAALQAAAAAHRDTFPGPVIGVTGSAGKTSTRAMLALLLGGDEVVGQTPANENNTLGLPLALLSLDPQRHRAAVLEAGISRPGEMEILARTLRPDAALVTLIAEAHLEGLGSLEGVAREKAVLLRHTRPAGFVVFPAACLSWDDFYNLDIEALILQPEDAPPPATLPPRGRLVNCAWVSLPGGGWRLRLTGAGGEESSFELPDCSPGLAANAALALIAALRLGQRADELRDRLGRWQPLALRGRVLRDGGREYYVDCYNSNPASLRDTLAAFARRYPEPPRRYILGGMEELGERAESLHRQAGARLRLGPGDRVLLFGGQAAAFREGAMEAGQDGQAIELAAEPAEAVRWLENFQGPVLLKGSRAYRLETILPPPLRAAAGGAH